MPGMIAAYDSAIFMYYFIRIIYQTIEFDEFYLLIPKYRVFQMGIGVRMPKNRQKWPKNRISTTLLIVTVKITHVITYHKKSKQTPCSVFIQ